jgi:hypothetical protein
MPVSNGDKVSRSDLTTAIAPNQFALWIGSHDASMLVIPP